MQIKIIVEETIHVDGDCCGVGYNNRCKHLDYEMPEEYCNDVVGQCCTLFDRKLKIIPGKDFQFKRCQKCINKTNELKIDVDPRRGNLISG